MKSPLILSCLLISLLAGCAQHHYETGRQLNLTAADVREVQFWSYYLKDQRGHRLSLGDPIRITNPVVVRRVMKWVEENKVSIPDERLVGSVLSRCELTLVTNNGKKTPISLYKKSSAVQTFAISDKTFNELLEIVKPEFGKGISFQR